MPATDDDDRPKKKITHEIGQELTLLSVGGYWLVSLIERRILSRFAPEQVSA